MFDEIEEDEIDQGQVHDINAQSAVKRRIDVFKDVSYIN